MVRRSLDRARAFPVAAATAALLRRFIYVASLSLATSLPFVEAADPGASVIVMSAVDFIYANESLPIYVIVENKGEDAIERADVVSVDSEFFTIEPGGSAARLVAIGPAETAVINFRATPRAELKPGSYTLLFDTRVVRKKGERARLTKALQVTVRSPLQSSISPPTVTITARPASDSLRESSNLDVKLLVENKSPLTLENVSVASMPSQALELSPSSAVGQPQIRPFGSWDKDWSVSLKLDQKGGPRYGKHTLFFVTSYDWKYGSSQFTTTTVTPVEVTAGFFGSEGFSQVFGVPLNLIVFVLPGFFLLFSYHFLGKKLVNRGEPFTPASRDGIFYSVFWSVILIVAYKSVLGRDLYAFFTSNDLLGIGLWGAVAGAVIPLFFWAKKWMQEREGARWQFSENDAPVHVLEKALHREPNPDRYQEASMKEGNTEWSGIVLATSADGIVLAAQFRIEADKELAELLEKMKPSDEASAKAFMQRLKELVGAREATVGIGDLTIQRDAKSYFSHIKILGPQTQARPTAVVSLVDFQYR